MPSPIITFRLTPHQLASGLQIIRSLDPNFKLTSLSQVVKIIYNDYLAKMILNHSNQIDPKNLEDIQNFISYPNKKTINLESLIESENK